jgi:hypothetical protein
MDYKLTATKWMDNDRTAPLYDSSYVLYDENEKPHRIRLTAKNMGCINGKNVRFKRTDSGYRAYQRLCLR